MITADVGGRKVVIPEVQRDVFAILETADDLPSKTESNANIVEEEKKPSQEAFLVYKPPILTAPERRSSERSEEGSDVDVGGGPEERIEGHNFDEGVDKSEEDMKVIEGGVSEEEEEEERVLVNDVPLVGVPVYKPKDGEPDRYPSMIHFASSSSSSSSSSSTTTSSSSTSSTSSFEVEFMEIDESETDQTTDTTTSEESTEDRNLDVIEEQSEPESSEGSAEDAGELEVMEVGASSDIEEDEHVQVEPVVEEEDVKSENNDDMGSGSSGSLTAKEDLCGSEESVITIAEGAFDPMDDMKFKELEESEDAIDKAGIKYSFSSDFVVDGSIVTQAEDSSTPIPDEEEDVNLYATGIDVEYEPPIVDPREGEGSEEGSDGSLKGSDGSSIMGMMEDGSKDELDVTSSGTAGDIRGGLGLSEDMVLTSGGDVAEVVELGSIESDGGDEIQEGLSEGDGEDRSRRLSLPSSKVLSLKGSSVDPLDDVKGSDEDSDNDKSPGIKSHFFASGSPIKPKSQDGESEEEFVVQLGDDKATFKPKQQSSDHKHDPKEHPQPSLRTTQQVNPPEVTTLSSTSRGGSSNYLSLKGRATPRDRGEGVGSTGPRVEPGSDLRELEGEVIKGADGRTTSGGDGEGSDVTSGGIPTGDTMSGGSDGKTASGGGGSDDKATSGGDGSVDESGELGDEGDEEYGGDDEDDEDYGEEEDGAVGGMGAGIQFKILDFLHCTKREIYIRCNVNIIATKLVDNPKDGYIEVLHRHHAGFADPLNPLKAEIYKYNGNILEGIDSGSVICNVYCYCKHDELDNPLFLRIEYYKPHDTRIETIGFYIMDNGSWIRDYKATNILSLIELYEHKKYNITPIDLMQKASSRSPRKYGPDLCMKVEKIQCNLNGYNKYKHTACDGTLENYNYININSTNGLPNIPLLHVSVYYQSSINTIPFVLEIITTDNDTKLFRNNGPFGWSEINEISTALLDDIKLSLTNTILLDLGSECMDIKSKNVFGDDVDCTNAEYDYEYYTEPERAIQTHETSKPLFININRQLHTTYSIGKFLFNDKILSGLQPGNYNLVIASLTSPLDEPKAIILQSATQRIHYILDDGKYIQVNHDCEDPFLNKIKNLRLT